MVKNEKKHNSALILEIQNDYYHCFLLIMYCRGNYCFSNYLPTIYTKTMAAIRRNNARVNHFVFKKKKVIYQVIEIIRIIKKSTFKLKDN
jgi:hypothetical protein